MTSTDMAIGMEETSGRADPGAAPEATVLHGAWLDSRTLLCSTTWPGSRSRQPVPGVASYASGPIPLRAHIQPLPHEGDRPAGTLLLLAFKDPVERGADLRALALEPDGQPILFLLEHPASMVVDLQTLLRENLAARSPSTREAIIEFLVESCGPAEADPTRAVSLRNIRDALRERRQPSVIAREVPQAVNVESIYRIDGCGFYVRGWSRDSSAETVRVTAVAPEGARVGLHERLYRYTRPDIDDFYGAPSDREPKAGFLAFFRTSVDSALPDGWVFELENAAGSAVEFAVGPIEDNKPVTRDTLLFDLRHELHGQSDLIRDHIHPAISTLHQIQTEGIRLARVEQYGSPPASPEVSVLVPLYGRIDFLEQQLAQFVHDPAMRDVDLIYLLDSPELSETLLQSAAWMESLYNVPFRVAIADRNGGFAAANNLAASIARGRLLLLLNSDVLPDKPGWLAEMVRAHDSIPNVGVVAPKLLYEDGSLQHAGLYFRFDRVSGTWSNEHYFKGLHGSLPAAQETRQVPAVTAACAMISADLYAELGGVQGAYVQGDFEDSDLCLRLYERGLGAWYVPEATLYHLEGQSYPSTLREMTGRYNRWLHSELWGDLIPRVMADLREGPTSGPDAAKPAKAARSTSRTAPGRARPDRDTSVGR